MAQVEANGASIAFQQWGEGPDIVFLHGLATNRAFWFASHAPALVDAGFRVTIFDLRGHGYSTMSESGYSASAMASDLLAVMNALEISEAHIIGHSYGGGVALEFAVENPGRVSTLTILDSRINRLQPQQWLHEGAPLTRFENSVLEASPADWDNETQIGLRYLETLARMTVSGQELPNTAGWTPFGGGRGGKRTATQFVRLLDFTEAAREFLVMGATPARIRQQLATTPVLLAYGEISRCLPSQSALQELIPHASSAEIANAGHFFPATHCGETRALLIDWLDQNQWPGQESLEDQKARA